MNPTKKSIWGWALYDWANSAFATTVMAGFFPIYFKQYWNAGVDVNLSSARLGYGNAAAGILIALMAPVLGAMADLGGSRKRFMLTFAYFGALMTAALFWVGQNQWHLALLAYGLAVVGFAGANIFYDALLPAVSDEGSVDFVSGLGYSMGYLGGGILFAINVLMVLFPERFNLPDAGAAVGFSFLSVALWWGGFCLFPLFWIRQTGLPGTTPARNRLAQGLRQLRITLSKIRRLKTAGIFLLAYWFYIDGVDTIIRMAVDYGLSLGFTSQDLILSLLLVQFVGFPAALGFGRLGQRWGAKKSIFLGIAIYMGVTVWGSLMTTRASFYGLAVMIGLVQGGVQALSRSYYSRLIPKDQAAEFYGFYNMMGKFSAIIGPALMATIGLVVRQLLMPENPTVQQLAEVGRLASRWSIASVLILFVIGAGLLMRVNEEKGRRELADFTAISPETAGQDADR